MTCYPLAVKTLIAPSGYAHRPLFWSVKDVESLTYLQVLNPALCQSLLISFTDDFESQVRSSGRRKSPMVYPNGAPAHQSRHEDWLDIRDRGFADNAQLSRTVTMIVKAVSYGPVGAVRFLQPAAAIGRAVPHCPATPANPTRRAQARCAPPQ